MTLVKFTTSEPYQTAFKMAGCSIEPDETEALYHYFMAFWAKNPDASQQIQNQFVIDKYNEFLDKPF